MRINITGNNLDLTPPLKEYIEDGLSLFDKFLGKYDPGSSEAHVVVIRTTKHHAHGDVYKVEVNLVIPKKTLTAQSNGSDVRAVFDEARDRLKKEFIKYKEQKSEHRS